MSPSRRQWLKTAAPTRNFGIHRVSGLARRPTAIPWTDPQSVYALAGGRCNPQFCRRLCADCGRSVRFKGMLNAGPVAHRAITRAGERRKVPVTIRTARVVPVTHRNAPTARRLWQRTDRSMVPHGFTAVTTDVCFYDLESGKRVDEATMRAFRSTGVLRGDFD